MDEYISNLESPICKYNLTDYDSKLSELFATGTPLCEAINKVSTTANDIMKWEWQIIQCLREFYFNFESCPVLNSADKILINRRKDIIASSVVICGQNKNYSNEITFMDTVIRVHSTIVGSIIPTNESTNRVNKIAILSIIASYFYTTAANSATSFNTSRACEFTTQLCEMVELGMIDNLRDLFAPPSKSQSLVDIFKAHIKLFN